MSTQIDWQHELDTAVATAPDRPVEAFVAAGRRAVRRRRIAAVAVVAAVAVPGVTWAMSPESSPRTNAPIATRAPSPDASEETPTPPVPTRPSATPETPAWTTRRFEELPASERKLVDFLGNPAVLTEQGLVLAPGTSRIIQRVENPMGYRADEGISLAIRAVQAGAERYSLLSADTQGSTSTMTVWASGDFDGWLAGAVRSQSTLDVANGVTDSRNALTPDEWLLPGTDGGVVAGDPSVELLEARTDVDLGDDFARGADATGVVRLRVDGHVEHAVYRVTGRAVEVIPGGGRFDSLTEFASWARDQYASGEGLR